MEDVKVSTLFLSESYIELTKCNVHIENKVSLFFTPSSISEPRNKA
jgi:hypothetical protein